MPKRDTIYVRDVLINILRRAVIMNTLKQGCKEVLKALDANTVRICVVAKDCENLNLVQTIHERCHDANVDLIVVEKGEELGDWTNVNPRNVAKNKKKSTRTAAVCVTKSTDEAEALSLLLHNLRTHIRANEDTPDENNE